MIPYFSAQVPGSLLDTALDIEVSVDFVDSAEDWEVVTLGVVRREGQPPIRTEALRQVPVALALRMALRSFKGLISDGEGNDYFAILASQREELQARRSDGPTAENLAKASEIYRMSRLVHQPPLVAVQDTFGLPNRTASHWIKLARERDHLPDLPAISEA